MRRGTRVSLTSLGITSGLAPSALSGEGLGYTQGWSGLGLVGLAVVGLLLSRGITPVPAANPTCERRINPVTDLWRRLALMRTDRDLWRATWGNTGFFFVAALVQMNLVIYAQDVLRLTKAQNAYLSLALALGIGFGSVAAGYASRGRIEYRLVPGGGAAVAYTHLTLPTKGEGVSLGVRRRLTIKDSG